MSSNDAGLTALVVDDELPALSDLGYLLGRDDRIAEVITASSGTEALQVHGEKGDVRGRHGIAHQLLRLFEVSGQKRRAIDPVAERGITSSMSQEMAKHLQLVEAAQEHLLVISTEDSYVPLRLPPAR